MGGRGLDRRPLGHLAAARATARPESVHVGGRGELGLRGLRDHDVALLVELLVAAQRLLQVRDRHELDEGLPVPLLARVRQQLDAVVLDLDACGCARQTELIKLREKALES